MKTAVIYPYPLDDRATFRPFAERYVDTYLRYLPGSVHRFIVVFCCGTPEKKDMEIFYPIMPDEGFHLIYNHGGIDIGAAQFAARQLSGEFDFMVASTSRVYFHREGWLRRLVEAREKHGEGLYGAAGSFEGWEWKPAPNPHMRTVLYGMSPKIYAEYPHQIVDRPTAHKFESGEWNYANWILKRGLPVKQVTWDGEYDKRQWRNPDNIFRRGDQTNMLCWDKHSDEYVHSLGNKMKRERLERLADGDIAHFPL